MIGKHAQQVIAPVHDGVEMAIHRIPVHTDQTSDPGGESDAILLALIWPISIKSPYAAVGFELWTGIHARLARSSLGILTRVGRRAEGNKEMPFVVERDGLAYMFAFSWLIGVDDDCLYVAFRHHLAPRLFGAGPRNRP